MSQSIRGVLFDLDDTLFDHHHATAQATAALRASEPAFEVWSPEELRRRHSEVLEIIHREVVAGRMAIEEARRERFRRLLVDAGAADDASERAVTLASAYRAHYEQNWRAVAGACELLSALTSRGIPAAVVTNNLTREQELKLRHCALDAHVTALVTSEATGSSKPAPEIFTAALDALGLAASHVVMVGDAWDTDIAGAIASGIRPIWFNWRRLPMRGEGVTEIASLLPTAETLRLLT